MAQAETTRKNEARGAENRVKVGYNIPFRLQRYIAAYAKAQGRSQSGVVSDLLDEAINGKPAQKSA